MSSRDRCRGREKPARWNCQPLPGRLLRRREQPCPSRSRFGSRLGPRSTLGVRLSRPRISRRSREAQMSGSRLSMAHRSVPVQSEVDDPDRGRSRASLAPRGVRHSPDLGFRFGDAFRDARSRPLDEVLGSIIQVRDDACLEQGMTLSRGHLFEFGGSHDISGHIVSLQLRSATTWPAIAMPLIAWP